MTDNKNNQTNQNDEKIEETVVSQENTDDIEDNFLQDELQELEEAEKKANENAKADFTPLLNKIKELESQLQEKDEIAKNSQINYLHLKADFDILQRQTDQKINNAESDSVIMVV